MLNLLLMSLEIKNITIAELIEGSFSPHTTSASLHIATQVKSCYGQAFFQPKE